MPTTYTFTRQVDGSDDGNPTMLAEAADINLLQVAVEDLSRRRALFFINAMDAEYGALGDGETDDTVAIQAAIDAAAATLDDDDVVIPGTGAKVILPEGIFRINFSTTQALVVNVKPGVELIGQGPGRTLLRGLGAGVVSGQKPRMLWLQDHSQLKNLTIDGNYDEVTALESSDTACTLAQVQDGADWVTIEDVEVCNQFSAGTNEGFGIVGKAVDHLTFRRVVAHHCSGSGIGINAQTGHATNILVDDCDLYHNGYTKAGVARENFIGGKGFATALTDGVVVRNTRSYDNVETGLNFEHTTGPEVESCQVTDNGFHGIMTRGYTPVLKIRDTQLLRNGNRQVSLPPSGIRYGAMYFVSVAGTPGGIANHIYLDNVDIELFEDTVTAYISAASTVDIGDLTPTIHSDDPDAVLWTFAGQFDGGSILDDWLYGKLEHRNQPSSAMQATMRFTNKMRQGVDTSLGVFGDSTGVGSTRWVYLLARWLASQYPNYNVIYQIWADVDATGYTGVDQIQTVIGGPTLNIWNMSVSGTNSSFVRSPYFTAKAITPQMDLAFLSHGHNEGSFTTATPVTSSGHLPEHFRARYFATTESLREANPKMALVCIAQNPFTGNTHQSTRAREIARVCELQGYGFINVHDAFLRYGDWEGDLVNPDGLHPNAAGQAIWLAEVKRAFQWQDGIQPQHELASLFQQGVVENLLGANADFSDFASPPTLPNWTAVNVTLSKELTLYESKNGYALRMAAPLAGNSEIHRDLPNFARFKGKTITLAARVLNDRTALEGPTGDSNAPTVTGDVSFGAVVIDDGPNTHTSRADLYHFGNFTWHIITADISASATRVRIYLYNQRSNAPSGIGKTVWDRVFLVHGIEPRTASSAI